MPSFVQGEIRFLVSRSSKPRFLAGFLAQLAEARLWRLRMYEELGAIEHLPAPSLLALSFNLPTSAGQSDRKIRSDFSV